MNNLAHYLWLIILIIYIISPRDLHPSLLDDLVAMGLLLYLQFKNTKKKRQRSHAYTYNQSKARFGSNSYTKPSLEDAYRILDVSPDASWEQVKKTYKEKIAKAHPDKVSHLSEELQEKAKELTLQLNDALETIKQNKTG